MKSKTIPSGSVVHVFEPGERHRVPVGILGGFADVPGAPPSAGRITAEIAGAPVICIDLAPGDIATGAVAFGDTVLSALGYATPSEVTKLVSDAVRWREKAEKLAERLAKKNVKR